MDTTSGTLDEALLRLHTSGPEFNGYLSNHGPMAVEATVRNGQAHTVHRWLDGYENKLEGVPRAHGRITDANWREALGDSSRVTEWTAYFTRQASRGSAGRVRSTAFGAVAACTSMMPFPWP